MQFTMGLRQSPGTWGIFVLKVTLQSVPSFWYHDNYNNKNNTFVQHHNVQMS